MIFKAFHTYSATANQIEEETTPWANENLRKTRETAWSVGKREWWSRDWFYLCNWLANRLAENSATNCNCSCVCFGRGSVCRFQWFLKKIASKQCYWDAEQAYLCKGGWWNTGWWIEEIYWRTRPWFGIGAKQVQSHLDKQIKLNLSYKWVLFIYLSPSESA